MLFSASGRNTNSSLFQRDMGLLPQKTGFRAHLDPGETASVLGCCLCFLSASSPSQCSDLHPSLRMLPESPCSPWLSLMGVSPCESHGTSKFPDICLS